MERRAAKSQYKKLQKNMFSLGRAELEALAAGPVQWKASAYWAGVAGHSGFTTELPGSGALGGNFQAI